MKHIYDNTETLTLALRYVNLEAETRTGKIAVRAGRVRSNYRRQFCVISEFVKLRSILWKVENGGLCSIPGVTRGPTPPPAPTRQWSRARQIKIVTLFLKCNDGSVTYCQT